MSEEPSQEVRERARTGFLKMEPFLFHMHDFGSLTNICRGRNFYECKLVWTYFSLSQLLYLSLSSVQVLHTNVYLCMKISLLFKVVRTNVCFCLCFSCCLSLFVYSEKKNSSKQCAQMCVLFLSLSPKQCAQMCGNPWASGSLRATGSSGLHREQSVKKPATSRPRCSFKDRLTQCLQQIGLLRFFKSRATEKP